MPVKKKEEFDDDLSIKDEKKIADQIFKKNDKNHPDKTDNGFRDILENYKPNVSASPIFIEKVEP